MLLVECTPQTLTPPPQHARSLESLQSSNNLRLLDHYPMTGQISDLLFVPPYLYVGQGMGGLTILKGEANRPLSLVSQYPDQSLVNPLAFEVRDSLLYIADRFRGLVIVDIGQPEAPHVIFERQVEGIATNILLHEELLILSQGASGITLWDIAEPTAPEELASYFQFVDYTKETAVHNAYFYLADNRQGGLKVLTRKSNGLFEFVRRVETDEYCDGVTVAGDLLIVRNRLGGLGVYSLQNPAEPQLLAVYDRTADQPMADRDKPMALGVIGDHLLAAFYLKGLNLISLADPTQPKLLDRVNYGSGAQNVALCLDGGDRVFLGDKSKGVLLYQLVLERNP